MLLAPVIRTTPLFRPYRFRIYLACIIVYFDLELQTMGSVSCLDPSAFLLVPLSHLTLPCPAWQQQAFCPRLNTQFHYPSVPPKKRKKEAMQYTSSRRRTAAREIVARDTHKEGKTPVPLKTAIPTLLCDDIMLITSAVSRPAKGMAVLLKSNKLATDCQRTANDYNLNIKYKCLPFGSNQETLMALFSS